LQSGKNVALNVFAALTASQSNNTPMEQLVFAEFLKTSSKKEKLFNVNIVVAADVPQEIDFY